MDVFAENLKRFLEEKGVTKREFAKKIGVSEIRLYRLMDDKTPLHPIEALNMLLYFDCKPTELFGNLFEGCFDE